MASDQQGDNITVGDISASHGIAIGRNAHSHTVVGNTSGLSLADAAVLRSTLNEFYKILHSNQIPENAPLQANTSAGKALLEDADHALKPEKIVQNVREIGEALKQANVVVEEGSNLWRTLGNLAPLLGRFVTGGAPVVASWFGVSHPHF